MFPSDRMAQLHPQTLGSIFVAFCDLQDYGGSILVCLHMGEQIVIIINKIKHVTPHVLMVVIIKATVF
jgi:hypothetical protein